MRRSIHLLTLLHLFASVLAWAQLPPVVIVSSPSQSVYFDGDTVTLDGSQSYARDGASIVHYNWYIDNVFYQDAAVTTKTFLLNPGEVTRALSVRLEVIDSYQEEASRTVSFTLHRRPLHYYYLTDHLGSVRATVQGGEVTLRDDFSGTLSQWTTVLGSGFTIVGGELANSSPGDNVAVNASAKLFTDGIVGADVTNLSGYAADANIVFRYQNPSNYYMVQAYNTQVMIFKKVSGTYYNVSNYNGTVPFLGGPFRLQATVSGRTITVHWKGQQVLNWTDTDPNNVWMSGKVGVRQCNGRTIHWDNFCATSGGPGQIASSDDFDAWGYVLDGRSTNNGDTQARYKFTGKERDGGETGYDYFGARYYDARVGRFVTVDRFAAKYPTLTPYQYAANSPLLIIDINGDSTFVTQNRNGTYTVVGGNLSGKKDDTGVYIRNADGCFSLVGNSVTSHSFVGDDGSFVEGAIIDLASTAGQAFVDGLVSGNPGLLEYVPNARNGEKYDFKAKDENDRPTGMSQEQYHYRGSMTKDGKIGSARDFGNIGAGLVAARQGLTWDQARLGFDAYDSYKHWRLGNEGVTTQLAQWIGFKMGLKLRALDASAN